MTNTSLESVNKVVWMALLAALTAVGAFVKIPMGPVPFSLQTFFVVMAGFVLGPRSGALCMCLYLAAGIIGLPVFSGGSSGFGHLFGPTGGYLIGFVVCAFVSGLAVHGRDPMAFSWKRGVIFGALGLALLFVFGVGRLKFVLDVSWAKAWALGALPFLPGAVVKLSMSVAVRAFMAARRIIPA